MPASPIRGLAAAAVSAGLLVACSTTPRPYAPIVSVPTLAQSAYETDLADCNAQVASGRRKDFTGGRTTSVVAGSAIGVGAGMATGAGAASGMGMMSGTAGAAGLATGFIVAAPIAIVVISKSIRAHKEREIKTATATCLHERGYEVSDWTRVPKAKAARRP